MKKCIFLLMVGLLVSCSAPAQVTPTTTVDTLTPPPSTATSTIQPTMTASPLPPAEVSYYRIRIEYSTTSDWSTLELLNPENVLAIKTLEVSGEHVNHVAKVEQLALNQPLVEAEGGNYVSMLVDYAIAPPALDQGLQFRLQKGDIGDSEVRISMLQGMTPELLQSFKHSGVVANSGGLNPKNLSVDLATLKDTLPLLAQVQLAGREKLVWAFFYMWYSPGNWLTSWLKDQPLELYDSGSKEIITRQVEQAQGAGIDGFISSWWGPGSDTDRNLKKLLEIAEEKNFKVSIYFETLAGENGTPLDESRIREWLAYAIEQYRDHPAFFKVDGKPLIIIWASATVPLDMWKNIFASLHDQGLDAVYLAMGYDLGNLDVFDGLHDYGVFTYDDLNQTYLSTARAVRNYSLLADEPVQKVWVATVQPGYDDTLQPTREGLVQERMNGDYYRFTWDAAIQSNPDWIFITTWNEWWEHTNIEPGKLYGDQYLQITKEYAARWKNR